MMHRDNDPVLDALIEEDIPFAVFKLPHETVPRFVMQSSGTPSVFRRIEDLNGRRGFVIAPFRITEDSPVLLIRPDCTDLTEVSDREIRRCPRKETKGRKDIHKEKDEYRRLFYRFHKPLAGGEMEKLVLSRSKTIDRQEAFSPARSFFRAVEKYPHLYVYLFHTPQSGTWLGSTPEILLTGTKSEWRTIALAGTRYPQSDTLSWDIKNIREQDVVSSYLLNRLSSFDITPETNGPYTVAAGNLMHLRTDFRFRLPDTLQPGTLLQALHPTPAVSGLPKEEAFRFIEENEGYDRLYYSGFLGMLDAERETGIYVNLRCMHIAHDSLTLFAGGGLLASSSLEDEWEETEYKLKTMLDILE
ncbi:MAG TPA: isochorismate synthase [Porphyromonadaceae bacterium]|nr:isochorismate synthase [Porphyromonadaceae bacterium]